MNKIIFIMLIVFATGSGCSTKPGRTKNYTRFYMNTYVTITVPSNTEKKFIEDSFFIFEKWDNIITSNRGKTNINKALDNLIRLALKIAEKTSGKYDPTIYPVTKVWGMYGNNWRLPEESEIKEALKNTGWGKIQVSSHNVIVPQNMVFDFGGVGKGWIVDKVVEFLQTTGVKEGIVDAGGDLRVWGNRTWNIGIKSPYTNRLSAVVKLKNKAVATSGDYENYFIHKSKKYHHIINPDTGYPAESGFNSITVIADNCSTADGFATALFISGKSGINKIEVSGYKCIMISKDEKYSSDGLKIKLLE